MRESSYNAHFYKDQREQSRSSAKRILPLVFAATHPRSIVDVGCGVGTWLAVCREAGISELLGIDGDYVLREKLEFPAEQFVGADLAHPIHLDRRYDLAISVEVAEHLTTSTAKNFVKSLVEASDLVLLSAAIPFQGGTDHMNEQWPVYWARLFAEHDYLPCDLIRQQIWNVEDVAPWYAQNCVLYVKRSRTGEFPALAPFIQPLGSVVSLVHPRSYLMFADPRQAPLNTVLAALPHAMIRYVRSLLSRILG